MLDMFDCLEFMSHEHKYGYIVSCLTRYDSEGQLKYLYNLIIIKAKVPVNNCVANTKSILKF